MYLPICNSNIVFSYNAIFFFAMKMCLNSDVLLPKRGAR